MHCADDGDDCQCLNGIVYYARKFNEVTKQIADFWEGTKNFYTLIESNSSKSIKCEPDSFEGVDPLPGIKKGCYCALNSTDSEYNQDVKNYWRSLKI